MVIQMNQHSVPGWRDTVLCVSIGSFQIGTLLTNIQNGILRAENMTKQFQRLQWSLWKKVYEQGLAAAQR